MSLLLKENWILPGYRFRRHAEFSFLIYCFSCNCGRKNEGIRFGRVWISAAVAAIVMYDAAGVRRAAGKQAKVLNKLIFLKKTKTGKILMKI